METLNFVLAVVATCAASVAVWLSWRTLRYTERIAYADVLLRLDDRARAFDDVHVKLRPGGEWADGSNGPESAKDWAAVDAYMGFFERIDFMVAERLIGIDYVDEFYGYRYDNLVAHPGIRAAKLEGSERASWRNFEALGERLRRHRAKRSPYGWRSGPDGSAPTPPAFRSG